MKKVKKSKCSKIKIFLILGTCIPPPKLYIILHLSVNTLITANALETIKLCRKSSKTSRGGEPYHVWSGGGGGGGGGGGVSGGGGSQFYE